MAQRRRRRDVPVRRRTRHPPAGRGFTTHETWNFAATRAGPVPALAPLSYFDLYRKQVVKQPDLVLAMQTCAHTRSPPSRRRATSPTTRRGRCATRRCRPAPRRSSRPRPGHLELALDYLAEAALIDLQDWQRNTRDGLHLAALRARGRRSWLASAGCGYQQTPWPSRPRLPSGITRLSFRIRYRGRRLRLVITAKQVRYELLAGEPLLITHHGERVWLADPPVVRVIPPAPCPLRPRQPKGRAPVPRARQLAAAGGPPVRA